MRYIEWAVMFLVAGVGIALANFVGFQVNFMDSVPGILILLAISFVSVVISKLVPFKLPVIAYCSLIGLLVASPLCPAREFVIDHGWCLCRNLHQRPAERVCKTGMENASHRGSGHDRNLYLFCYHRPDCSVSDTCDLINSWTFFGRLVSFH